LDHPQPNVVERAKSQTPLVANNNNKRFENSDVYKKSQVFDNNN